MLPSSFDSDVLAVPCFTNSPATLSERAKELSGLSNLFKVPHTHHLEPSGGFFRCSLTAWCATEKEPILILDRLGSTSRTWEAL